MASRNTRRNRAPPGPIFGKQRAALLKQQQELEQQNRQAQTERVQAEQERAHQRAEQYRAQKAERQAERQNSQNDQHQAALAKELLIAALQRQQEELIHQRSAATDLSTQERLDAQRRQISQELQTAQSR